MTGSKIARNQSSLVNQTSIYGIMGGLAPTRNARASIIRIRLIKGRSNLAGMPTRPVPGLEYLRANDMLSVNPQGSGGVGKRVLLYTTGQQQPSTH